MSPPRHVAILALAALLTFPAAAQATTFVVNTLNDTTDVNPGNGVCADDQGACSLRAAVMEANALAGDDNVLLPAGSYELWLADDPEAEDEDFSEAGDLDVSDNITITGAGPGVTIIDGVSLDGILTLFEVSATIRQLTLRGGFALDGGGALVNVLGTMTVEDVVLIGNVSASGGGAITNFLGILTVVRTAFESNAAVCGGAIENIGELHVTNATFVGNTAECVGGGLLDAAIAPVTVDHSTFAFNTPENINVADTVEIRNSLFVTLDGGENCFVEDIDEADINLGGNFAAGAPCDTIPVTPEAALLSDLTTAANGQRVMLPLAGNPVVDGGLAPCASDDQRGIERPQIEQCDSGAVEVVGLAITSGPPPAAPWNVPYIHLYTAAGEGAVTFAVSAGLLPPGLSLSPAGVLTGTPTTIGIFNFTVTASDGTNRSDNVNDSIEVTGAPLLLSGTPPQGISGTPYVYPFTASGNGVVAFSLQSGPLPAGLTLSAGGVLSGTPSETGTFPFTVLAQDQGGLSTTLQSSVTIVFPLLLSGAPPRAVAGQPYSFGFTASGNGTVTMSIQSGALPSGLLLSSAGVLAGTTTELGTFAFTVLAQDQAGLSTTLASSIRVIPPLLLSGTPPLAHLGQAYTYGFTSSGAGTVTLTVSAGALPMGMTLSGAGVLSGTPGASGVFTFTVQATDEESQVQTLPASLTVNGPPVISGLAAATIPENTSAVLPFALSDDLTPVGSLTVAAASDNPSLLPNGNVIVACTGGNCTLTLTPLPDLEGQAVVTLTAGDGTLTATATVQLTVTPAAAPNAPTGLTVTVSGRQATFTWTPPASGPVPRFFVLELGSVSGGSGVAVIHTRTAVTTWSMLLAPSGYYARVRSGNGSGLSPTSNEVAFSVNSVENVPGPPRGLNAVIAPSGQVTIGWNPPAIGGAPTGWQVQVGTTPFGSDVGTFELPLSPLTAAGTLAPGDYFLRLRGRNAFGLGVFSNELQFRVGAAGCSAAPDAPVMLTPMLIGWTGTLQWTPPVNAPATSYQVLVGSAPGLADLATLTTATTSSFFEHARPGTYYVAARALNACGTGPASNTATAVIGPSQYPPAPPTNVRAQVTGSTVRILWDGSPGAGSHVVEAGGAPGQTGAAIITVGANELVVTNVPKGSYYVRVRGNGEPGAGAPSAEILIVVP